jgi:putative cardiolipin synthase
MRGFKMTASKLRNMLAMLTFIGMLTGCATVSLEQPKSYSTAITDTDDTALGQYAANKAAQHDNQSGFYPLIQGMDALGTRLRLAEKAEKASTCSIF